MLVLCQKLHICTYYHYILVAGPASETPGPKCPKVEVQDPLSVVSSDSPGDATAGHLTAAAAVGPYNQTDESIRVKQSLTERLVGYVC